MNYKHFSPATHTNVTFGTVAPGRIIRARDAHNLGITAEFGDEHPVLVGTFDKQKFNPLHQAPTFFACGELHADNLFGFQCRWQCGADVLHWFVNAADPEAWRWLDQCNANGKIVLAALFLDGQAALQATPFSLPKGIDSFRTTALSKGRKATEAFRLAVGEIVATGDYGRLGNLNVPNMPPVRSVQGALVETAHTSGMRWPLPPDHQPCKGQLLVPTADGRDITFYRGAEVH